jgi:hypothetical protein
MYKKKGLSILLLLSVTFVVRSQETIVYTDHFTIEGKVKNSFSFSLDQAGQYAQSRLDSLVIYNHLMQRRRSIKNIKGILLRDIIEKAVIDVASPKILSEIYITCIAADNYKVVFSWNELFNTAIGKQVMIITESDGLQAKDSKDNIALIAAADQATGRRFVKGLSKIIIEQVK